jgi:hypothetical protein
MKPLYIIFFLAGFGSLNLNAQSYYPGGLGNSNLFLWLNASKNSSITQNGANQVSQWADGSGNGYNFSQATAGNRPVFGAAASPSGKPALTFTSTSSQYLSIGSLPASISFTGGISTFAVASYNAPQTAQGWQRIFDFGNGQASANFMMGRNGSTATSYYEAWNGGTGDQTYTSVNTITNASENLYEIVQQPGTAGTLTTAAHYLAGVAQAATGQAGSSQTYIPAAIARSSNFIGRSNWAADNYFSGTMSEILLYNTALNTTQRVILENYLSAGWNQTVGVSKYTPPTATTYGTNLVGIGYTSSTDNFLADVAGSTDGLGFSSGTTAADFLQNAGYLMAAHNGQSNTVIANATVPGIISASPLSLWNRSWNVQKTGGTAAGSVTLNFNFSDYNATTPSGANTYTLLYNATDGTFNSGTNKLATTSSTTVSGNTVAFKLIASNLAAGYYTVLYSTSPITLPVVLNTFTVTKQGSNSLLDWSLSDQTGLSRFDIQRAGDGVHFSTIASVAVSNGNASATYAFTDVQSLSGMNYYRLAMVDQDGTVTYSAIHTLNFETSGNPEVSLQLYPNPVTDRLHLAFSDLPGTMKIRIIDTRGQVIRTITAASVSVDLPVSDLTRGIYIIEVGTANFRYAREFIKN